jgi:uncharacterized membrane protein
MPVYHPEFVHFPIALIALSVILDWIGAFSRSERLAAAAWWTLFGAAIGGVATVATGLYDMYKIPIDAAAHRYVEFHMWVGIALLAAAAVLAVWRGVLYFRHQSVRGAYLAAGLLILCLVTFQNWLGGELVYAYGVGVAPTGQSQITETQAQRPLKKFDEILPQEVSHHHHDEQEHEERDVR